MPETMQKPLDKDIICRVMNRAIQISRSCPEECRDFEIMQSPMREGILILRWTSINIENIDKPVQCYHYECFSPDGQSQHCSIHFSSQQEANEFFYSLQPLHRQQFANDHKL